MNVCILCEDQFVEEVRENSKDLFLNHKILSQPLSTTGKLPATHWFCFCNISSEKFEELQKRKKRTVIKNCTIEEILNEFKLKKIESR